MNKRKKRCKDYLYPITMICYHCKKSYLIYRKYNPNRKYCSKKCMLIGKGLSRQKFNKTPKGKIIEKNRLKKISIKLLHFNQTKEGEKNRELRGKKISISKKKFYSTTRGKELAKKISEVHGKKMKKFYKTKKGKQLKLHLSKIGVQNCHSNLSKQSKHKWILNTKTKTYEFRSNMELVVAKYFIDNNITFIYETELNNFFIKSMNCYYLNDFYLPNENIYIQVKGNFPKDNKGIKKFNTVIKEYPNKKFLLWTRDVLKKLGIDYK